MKDLLMKEKFMKRRAAKNQLSIGWLLVLSLSLAGAAPSARAQAEPVAGGPEAKANKAPFSNERQSGIVICEPISAPLAVDDAPENDLADFGAGCGRWLFWAVGGLPHLGATPAWSEINEVEARLKRADLRLRADEIVVLSTTLGVNRVATGEIKSLAQAVTLTYQVHQTIVERDGELKEIGKRSGVLGAPIVVSGSREEIVEQLPEMARQILLRCGMENAPVMAAVGATAAELALCGQAQTSGEIPGARREEFGQLASRLPLANLLAVLYESHDDEKSAAQARAQSGKWFLEQAPDNTLMIGEILPLDAASAQEYEAALTRLQREFPGNYNIARAMSHWRELNDNLTSAGVAANDAIGAALFNPFARLYQARLDAAQAQAMRQGRMAADITAQEWKVLRQLYTSWYRDASAATILDATSSPAWTELATASTFCNLGTWADYALNSALQMDPKNVAAYAWGLEMYQPKWTDKGSAKLNKLVARAMQHDDVTILLYQEMVDALDEDPESVKNKASAAVLEKALQLFRKASLENPEITELHLEVAGIIMARPIPVGAEEIAEARRHLERALELTPESAVANYQMGMLFKIHLADKEQAEKYLRRAAELAPDWPAPQAALEDAL